jgi:hypothetical protein
MTVLVQYAPEKFTNDGTLELTFTFESIGAIAIEVYVETATADPEIFDRVLLLPQSYTLELFGGQETKKGGKVTLQPGVVPASATRISIERNTPITQLLDVDFSLPFSVNMIEFAWDKLTMIIQELADKKCSVTIAGGTIDQTIGLRRQSVLYENTLDFAIDKLTDYCLQMDTTGQDCGDKPQDTGLDDGTDTNRYPEWLTG